MSDMTPSAAAVAELREWLADTSTPDEELQVHTRRAILACEDFTRHPVTDWAEESASLKHGIIRLAADLARGQTTTAELHTPPPAVAALWRPWRRMQMI